MTEEGRIVNRRDLKRAINSICIVYRDGEHKVKCHMPEMEQMRIKNEDLDLLYLLTEALSDAANEAEHLETKGKLTFSIADLKGSKDG
tara:strand:+ start:190 stop:453 length:264 start_codon:yes stop_codon:yes gene_type:complete